MSRADELRAELAAKRARAVDATKERRDAEFVEHVFPLLDASPDHFEIEVEDPAEGVPTYVVLRPMNGLEWRNIKAKFAKDKSKPGVIEEQSRVPELAVKNCLVYPTPEAFAVLVERHPSMPEACFDKLFAKAQAKDAERSK